MRMYQRVLSWQYWEQNAVLSNKISELCGWRAKLFGRWKETKGLL